MSGWGTDEDELFDRLRARPLGRSLKGFFENGGTTAVAVRIEDAGTAAVRAGLAALDEVDLVNLVVLPAESADREDQRATVAESFHPRYADMVPIIEEVTAGLLAFCLEALRVDAVSRP